MVKARGVKLTRKLDVEAMSYVEANGITFNQLVKVALKAYLYQQKVKAEPLPRVAQPIQNSQQFTLGV